MEALERAAEHGWPALYEPTGSVAGAKKPDWKEINPLRVYLIRGLRRMGWRVRGRCRKRSLPDRGTIKQKFKNPFKIIKAESLHGL